MTLLLYLPLFFISSVLFAASFDSTIEDVRHTKHNLSSVWPKVEVGGVDQTPADFRNVKAEKEKDICVFCHTPHGTEGKGPLWNRNFSQAIYTPYQPQRPENPLFPFGSLDSDVSFNQPSGYSKLCLSCHDGTIAFTNVINAPGSGRGNGLIVGMQGTMPDSTIPEGKGVFTGDTRRLGIDLTNDHPISFVFDQNVSDKDKELRIPTITSYTEIGKVRLYPLDFNVQEKNAVQCTSCHNPHTNAEKFLREPRYDELGPGETNQICYSCHPKPGWLKSTHEISQYTYNKLPDFPETDGKTVGEHGCLNCHDPHTMQGADRLHRNGASEAKGTPAIENTCFQCHISSSEKIPVLGGQKFVAQAPDIKTHFDKRFSTGSAMPLDTNWVSGYTRGTNNGVHQPEFVSNLTLGKESTLFNPEDPLKFRNPGPQNIHVECVDCHNPHQVDPKNRMRGMKGIRIDGQEIGGDTNTAPTIFSKHNFRDDRSPGGVGGPAPDPETGYYDPLIYEICLRCHGDTFARIMPYVAKGADTSDDKGVPMLGKEERNRGHTEGGLLSLSSVFGASNKRKEFNPDTPSKSRQRFSTERKEYLGYNSAYHPVAAPGRNGTLALFNQLKKAFKLNSQEDLNNLTIMCTDCHNNDAFNSPGQGPVTGRNDGTSYRRSSDRPSNLSIAVEIDSTQAQGPHGSTNKRILRARYDTVVNDKDPRAIGLPSVSQIKERFALCFICHEANILLGEPPYQNQNSENTNFGGNSGITWEGNLHAYHLRRTAAYCHECHNNVHSNAEANNTIFGNGLGSNLHPDGHTQNGDDIDDTFSDSHLINFGPQAKGDSYLYPNWYYENGVFRCNLRCHNRTMSFCNYTHEGGGTLSQWCAGDS